MGVEKGQIFTPDKKKILIDEVQNEINNLNNALNQPSVAEQTASLVRGMKNKLQEALNVLFEKKGVVTPQETDDILNKINEAKRSRLESNYLQGMKRSTLYLVGFILIGLGVYYYTRKKTK